MAIATNHLLLSSSLHPSTHSSTHTHTTSYIFSLSTQKNRASGGHDIKSPPLRIPRGPGRRMILCRAPSMSACIGSEVEQTRSWYHNILTYIAMWVACLPRGILIWAVPTYCSLPSLPLLFPFSTMRACTRVLKY